jgi:hypothetical protein
MRNKLTQRVCPLILIAICILPTCALARRQDGGHKPEVRELIAELRKHPWPGPRPVAIPLEWDFQFTEPMLKILEVGSSAQDALIESLHDPEIKAQAIILLGGVGDERSVGPIIDAMAGGRTRKSSAGAEQVNLAANIALTNITAAEVIWHHGGGVVATKPPADSKKRWERWWKKNKETFTVKGGGIDRRYSNYPNYGIYKQS